ncbi:hypothetical protein [Hasllibacter halocynthiae]|uniref:hypothetical protein n=1 Tax=Hasllibacter halocynthiae TaxID=595589 RepID=UPI0011B28B2D|nr:hypothetical protein [Hasllibacter halocynthiae]
MALLWLVPAAHADTLLDNEPEVVPLIVDAPDQAEVPVERDAETGLSSPTHTAATPLTAPDLLPNSAVPENFEIVDYRTMDPSQLLRVRAYDLGGTRIGTLDSWWPADAETFEGIEAAVIGEGGLFGLFDTDIAVPLDRIAVLAEMGGNGLRVVVAAPAEEMDAFPEVDG